MEKVAEYGENNPDVLVTLNASEFELSVSVYLQEEHGMTSVYNTSYSENDGLTFYDGWICSSDEKESIRGDEAQIYIGYQEMTADFMKKQGLNPDDFNVYNYGKYDAFIRKDIDDISL